MAKAPSIPVRLLRFLPSALLFWAAGMVQGVAIAWADAPSWAIAIASLVATACFTFAGALIPSRF